MRADSAADFRQRISLVRQLGSFKQPALRNQVEPLGNVVVNRTLPLTIGISTGDATSGLSGRGARIILLENFVPMMYAGLCGILRWILPWQLQELEMLFHSRIPKRRV